MDTIVDKALAEFEDNNHGVNVDLPKPLSSAMNQAIASENSHISMYVLYGSNVFICLFFIFYPVDMEMCVSEIKKYQ